MSMGTDNLELLSVRNEVIPGAARFLSAGRGITRKEPMRPTHQIETEDEGRKAVRDNAALGVQIIKIWVDDRDGKVQKVTPAQYAAIIDEAHKLKIRTTAHIYSMEDAKGLMRAGLDSFAHGDYTFTADEMAGYNLFKGKGNCNSCHVDGRGTTLTSAFSPDNSKIASTTPLFTCFGSANEGLPLNPRDAIYYQNKPDSFWFTANPDGFAFDAYGNLWVTLVMTDQLIAITPEGEVLTLLDDSHPEAARRLNEHYEARTLTPEIMGACAGTLAPWMASLTFGGPDLRTVYLGSLRGTTLPSFRSPVAGLAPIHWNETCSS